MLLIELLERSRPGEANAGITRRPLTFEEAPIRGRRRYSERLRFVGLAFFACASQLRTAARCPDSLPSSACAGFSMVRGPKESDRIALLFASCSLL